MRIFAMILGLMAGAGPGLADENAGGIAIELNTIGAVNGACQLTFVAETSHPGGVDKVLFETVLFKKSGAVDRLTLFDFGKLPAGRPRVRQFVIPDLACADLGRILINGINECQAPGLEAAACAADLRVISRVDVELLG